MSAEQNKQIITSMMHAIARGDWEPFFAFQTEDFAFIITGHTQWSKSYQGKDLVRRELFEPLFKNFAEPYRAQIGDVVAEEERVVVEFKGHVMTSIGNLYNNEHCWVCHLTKGKLTSVREYAASLLVHRVISAHQSK